MFDLEVLTNTANIMMNQVKGNLDKNLYDQN